ncbi:hypothetical protein GCM10010320_50190 [Streptomyces caelestis]|nr:hypothetical protein GCM10010320_50190 [Streptomyces caelestis]
MVGERRRQEADEEGQTSAERLGGPAHEFTGQGRIGQITGPGDDPDFGIPERPAQGQGVAAEFLGVGKPRHTIIESGLHERRPITPQGRGEPRDQPHKPAPHGHLGANNRSCTKPSQVSGPG